MDVLFKIDFENNPEENPAIPEDPNIEHLLLLNCNEEQFYKLAIPKNITNLVFVHCDLEVLKIPEHITYCICSSLGLKELFLPESIHTIYCEHNCLKSLTIPQSCKYVYAEHNKLMSIYPKELPHLLELYVKNNRLKQIDLTEYESLAFVECDVDVVMSQEMKNQLEQKEKEEFDLFRIVDHFS
jgi:Leucine-rich repeat (LRR) protein